MNNYTAACEAADVTDEIITIALSIYAGWFGDGQPIDWENFLDRLDGAELADGSKLDLGESMVSPAIKKIKSEIRAYSRLEA